MVSLSDKTRDPVPIEDRIPREIISHIVSFLSLDEKTILNWESISKQFYSVAEQHWVTLWNTKNPSAQLRKNHRFGCLQLFAYRQQHTRNSRNNYNINEVKIVIAGAGGVGKSALTIRYVQDAFVAIEDSYRKQVEINGVTYMVDILDTAGPEEYSAMQDQYFRVTHAVLFCCDLALEYSLDEMRDKIDQLAHAKDEDPENLPIIISVNKCDKGLTGHALSMEQVRQFAAEYKINTIMETSALDGTNVKEVFRELVLLTVDSFRRHPEWIEKIENGEPITTITARKKKCNVM